MPEALALLRADLLAEALATLLYEIRLLDMNGRLSIGVVITRAEREALDALDAYRAARGQD